MLDGLAPRNGFFQSYTTCQPEHGVADNMSADQPNSSAIHVACPSYNPRNGETSQEAFDLKRNPTPTAIGGAPFKSNGEEHNFNVAHWALTGAVSASTSKPSKKRKPAS